MGKWEDVLAIFASSAQTSLVDRGAVAGKDVKWPPGDGNGDRQIYSEWKTSGQEGMPHDAWWGWNFHYTDGYDIKRYGCLTYGINFDYSTINAGSPFDRWQHEFLNILSPLRNPPFANDRVDLGAFMRVAKAHEQVRLVLDDWAAKTKAWVDEVDAPDGDWQGSAAGAFHTVLGAYYGEIASFRNQLADNGVEAALNGVLPQLQTSLDILHIGFTNWRNTRLYHPALALQDALADAMRTATVEVRYIQQLTPAEYDAALKSSHLSSAETASDLTFKVTSPLGDPDTKEFWEKVVVRAKELWLGNLGSLDNEATRALIFLETAYTTLSNRFNASHPRVEMRMPPPVAPKVDVPPGTGGAGAGGKDDPTKDIKDDINNIKQDLGGGSGNKDFKLDGGGGGGSTGGIGGIGGIGGNTGNTGAGAGGSGAKPPTSLPKPPEIGIGGGGGGGSTLPGGGSTLPGGGTGVPGGGPTLPGGGSWTGGVGVGGGVGSGGRNVVVPPGSRVTEDGRVVDSEGRPVLDSRGNPMVVGRDYTIAPDGTLLDGQGTPVTQSRQALDDLGRNYLDRGDDLLAPNDFGFGASGIGGSGLLGSGGGAGGSLLTGPGGISPITGAVAGTNARGFATGGDPTTLKAAADAATERIAAERAARAAAAEQAALNGSRVNTTGGTGMPPMMPPGGMGAGGAGGANEKDRQRTTWLAEDEEVWGTETGAVEGVIGR
ncbi:hypothetical protein [Kitasatospora sp. NPDC056184]|uniref:hypothetical protein n=1 Tax=Kitasatospora sp. NPDC056184 TaxID=3345738 RepID=UPI0035D9F8B2